MPIVVWSNCYRETRPGPEFMFRGQRLNITYTLGYIKLCSHHYIEQITIIYQAINTGNCQIIHTGVLTPAN